MSTTASGQERTGSKGIDANMMRFGPNTYLVEEIANYARNGDLFVSPFRGDVVEADTKSGR
jgi:hypothetical protein